MEFGKKVESPTKRGCSFSVLFSMMNLMEFVHYILLLGLLLKHIGVME